MDDKQEQKPKRLPRTAEEIFGEGYAPVSDKDYQDYLTNSPDNYREYESVRRGE